MGEGSVSASVRGADAQPVRMEAQESAMSAMAFGMARRDLGEKR